MFLCERVRYSRIKEVEPGPEPTGAFGTTVHAPVLAVLPVLFANGDERAFFTARPELLAGLVREILATPGLSRLCIVAEEGVSLPPADGARVQVIRLPVADRPRTAAHPFDCPGLAAALADPDQAAWKHVLCLDSRQPRQTAAVLAAALDRYFRETPPVMSAKISAPGIRFSVCGPGGDYPELTRQIRALGLTDRFALLGPVTDVRPVLAGADVFGYPLCRDNYAAGELVLQEAAAAGLPAVVFPFGGAGRMHNGLVWF